MTKYFSHIVVFGTSRLRGVWGDGIHDPKLLKARTLPFLVQGGLDKKCNYLCDIIFNCEQINIIEYNNPLLQLLYHNSK
jgi:hypothetical protein